MAWKLGLSVFLTSRQTGRIPLVLVLGECIDLTRAFLNILLMHQEFDDSVVISTKHSRVAPLIHPNHIELPRVESSAQESCLCCGMHGALGDSLRTLFFGALNNRRKRLDRVLIESDSIDALKLAHTLKHTPFLGQRYVHQLTFRVVNLAQLFMSGLDALKGLDLVNNQSQQFLVCMNQGVSGHSDSIPLALSTAELKAWSAQIERTLPYQKVLFVGIEDAVDSGLNDDPLSVFLRLSKDLGLNNETK